MRFSVLLLVLCLSGCVLAAEVQVYNPNHAITPTQNFCNRLFFFGMINHTCPTSDVQKVSGAFQAYDGGYMVWEDYTGSVYILYNDGSGQHYTEDVVATFPENAIQELPPPNHFKPIRGFARVWLHENDLRQRLGWPYGIEQAYIIQIQPAHETVFFDLPSGQVIEFEASGNWHVVD